MNSMQALFSFKLEVNINIFSFHNLHAYVNETVCFSKVFIAKINIHRNLTDKSSSIHLAASRSAS